jgi:hypothetical protein
MPRGADVLRAIARRTDRGASRNARQIVPWQALVCTLAVVLALAADSARAAAPTTATSSRAAREDAIRSIPFERLAGDMQAKVRATVADNSLFRRLPVQVMDCDPDLYLFMVRHPEVVVNIWEVMKISNVAIERTGPDTFRASDKAGTLCDVKYCHSTHDTQLIYAEGSYNGPLLSKPVRAKCVLLLKSGYVQETNGRYYVTSRMDTFIQIDHVGVEILAKSLQPLMHRSADYNFVETASFFGSVSRAAEMNPAGISRLAAKLTKIAPDVQDEFAETAMGVSVRSRQRQSVQTSSAAPLLKSAPLGAAADRR